MIEWKKTGREADDGWFRIESRKRAIPHANGEGYWMHTSYWLIDGNGNEKEYWSLKDAKEAAEKGYEHGI